MLAKKQQPTLAERFEASYAETRRLALELTEGHAHYLKECHRDLPIQTLMADLTKFRSCHCVVAHEVIEKDKQRL